MNVAFFVDKFPKLTQTFILNQITGLIDAGHDVTVFALHSVEEPVTHKVIREYDLFDRTIYTQRLGSYSEGIVTLVETLPVLLARQPSVVSHAVSSCKDWKAFPWIVRELQRMQEREHEFDVCHAHFGPVGNQFLPVFNTTDIPIVVSFYGYDASRRLSQDPDHYDALFPRMNTVTALSDFMSDKLTEVGCPEEKIVKQPLAVDTEKFDFQERTADDDTITIVSVARMTEKKGLKYGIEAIGMLANGYDIEYRIVGDGHLRTEIERQIASLGLEDTVELLGWKDQQRTAEIMESAHLFLLPSVTAADGDEEGTPTVLLEAQAMGLPVVSTYHSGIPEIVADRESGLLVPERSPAALARALQTLLDEPNRWGEMGRTGRERIEDDHSIAAAIDRLERIYECLD